MSGRAGGAVGSGGLSVRPSGRELLMRWYGWVGCRRGYGRELRSVPLAAGVAVRCGAVQLVADMTVLLRVVDMAVRS